MLKKENITTAFGVLGTAINPFYSAIRRHGGIRHILTRHVEGVSHMAEGYTRATAGNIGAYLGTSGPADADMITALYSASADSIPILYTTGQTPRTRLHEEGFRAIDVESIAKPVSRIAITVHEVALLPRVLQQAFHIMRSGRPGLVLIDSPFNIQAGEIEFSPEMYEPLPVYRPAASRKQVERALGMLIRSKRPVIIAEGGVINADACELLQRFAELAHVPVIPTLMGWGCIPDDHELVAGMVGLQTAHRYGSATLLASDMVFGIGSRFTNRHTDSIAKYTEERKIIHIDIEPTRIGCVLCPDLGIVSDAEAALTLPIDVAQEMQKAGRLPCRNSWVDECQQRKWTLLRKTHFDNAPVKPQRVYEEVNKAFGHDVYYATTIRLSQIAATQILHVFKNRHWINCGQVGPPGWTLPVALEVCVADSSRNVVGISGGFNFRFLIEELTVGAQFNIPYVHVLISNACLELVRQSQRAFDMDYCMQLVFRNINSNEVNGYGVDRVKVAEGLGCKAIRVFRPKELVPAFEQAKTLMEQYRVPVVVEVIPERMTDISMGSELDNATEFEEIADDATDAPTGTCFTKYEQRE